jgi:hypothetical protein
MTKGFLPHVLVLGLIVGCGSGMGGPLAVAQSEHAPPACTAPSTAVLALDRWSVERPYLGTIGEEDVVFWLQRQGPTVRGRYYSKSGNSSEVGYEGRERTFGGNVRGSDRIDIFGSIAGYLKLDADGSLTGMFFEESAKLRPAMPRTGWSPAPIPLLVHRHYKKAEKSRDDTGSEYLECDIDVDYPEIVGGFAPEVEARFNAFLRVPVEAVPCQPYQRTEAEWEIHTNQDGVLSVTTYVIPEKSNVPNSQETKFYGYGRTVQAIVPGGTEISLRDVLRPDVDFGRFMALAVEADGTFASEVLSRFTEDNMEFYVNPDSLHLRPVDVRERDWALYMGVTVPYIWLHNLGMLNDSGLLARFFATALARAEAKSPAARGNSRR